MRFAWIISIALMSFIPLFNAQVEYKYHELFPNHHISTLKSPSSLEYTIPGFINVQEHQSYKRFMRGVWLYEIWITRKFLTENRDRDKKTPVTSPHTFAVNYAIASISCSDENRKIVAGSVFNATASELTLPLNKSSSTTKAIMSFLKLYKDMDIVMNIAMSHSCRIDPGLQSLLNELNITFYGSSATEFGSVDVTSQMIWNMEYRKIPAVICTDRNTKNVNRILAETRRGTIWRLGDAEFFELSSDISDFDDLRMIFIRPNKKNNKTFDSVINNFYVTLDDFSKYEEADVMFDIPTIDKESVDEVQFNGNYKSFCTDYGNGSPHDNFKWTLNSKFTITTDRLEQCAPSTLNRSEPIDMSESPFIILFVQRNSILLYVVVE